MACYQARLAGDRGFQCFFRKEQATKSYNRTQVTVVNRFAIDSGTQIARFCMIFVAKVSFGKNAYHI